MRPLTPDRIRRSYQESLRDLRSIRTLVVVSLLLFLGGIVIGFTYPAAFDGLFKVFQRSIAPFFEMGLPSLIGSIFLRNAVAAAAAILLGVLFGIVPVLQAVMNGALIGISLARVETAERLPMLLMLLPHGVFELPAIFIAWGAGIWHGIYRLRKSDHTIGERRRKIFRIFFLIIVPLLVIAAIIEGAVITLR